MLQAQCLLGLIIFIFGSCIFSFLNVVIYRLPRCLSFVKGFSACPSCGHRLYGKDMVPVLSWIRLKGKCRYCGARVSGRYSLVETMGGIAALLCCWKFGFGAAAANAFALLSVLTVIAFIDIDTMEIPNELNLCVLLLGVFSIFTMPQLPLLSRLIGLIAVSAPMLAIAVLIPGGFGGGDIKLMAASGLLLGWKLNLAAVLIGIFAGGIYGAILLLQKKAGRKDHFAFGPFLCFGLTLALFVGDPLITWYLHFFPTL